MPEFKQRLKELRKGLNLTQKQLAEQLGIATSTIIKYEHGDREPNIQNIKKLASFFNVTVDNLLGFDSTFENMSLQEKSIALYHENLRESPKLLRKMEKIVKERRQKIIYKAFITIVIKYHLCTPNELASLSIDELDEKIYEYGKSLPEDEYKKVTDEIFSYLSSNNYFAIDVNDSFESFGVAQRRMMLWEICGAELGEHGIKIKDRRYEKIDKMLSEEETLVYFNVQRVLALKYGICTLKDIQELNDMDISEKVFDYKEKLSGELKERFNQDEIREQERQGFATWA